ncbi:MAG: hypothetical protein ACKO40_07710 [Planctomycetaceae bacterium]
MRSPASIRTWGPSFRYALPMVAAALGLAWAAWKWERGTAPQTVTALKPVLGDEAGEERPVEAAYGVPSARTLMLWRPFWPPAG